MAQTLKFGKGTWATKTGSSMAYNDQNGNYKPLPFNVERDSIATRVNKQGLIEVVGKDKLRIDYTDSAKGVALLENSSTNLITYSEDFSQSYWLKLNNVTVSAEKVISPDGTLNASQLIFDGTSGGRIERGLTGLTQGADYTVSVYARVSSGTQIVRFGSVNDFEYTLTTEWQRLTSTETENDTAGYPRLRCNDAATIEVWGFQLEQNSVASSYIPTSGTTVQRQADVVNGSGNSEVFNDSEGVLFANVISNGGTTNGYITISDLSTNNRLAIRIGYNNSNKVSLFMVSNGGSAEFEVFYDVGSLGFSNFNKFALKYKLNDVSLFFNGFEVITISSAAMASGFKSLNFANATGGTQPFYGKAKELGYYDAILTDSELEYLTSYRSLNELVTELNLNTL